MGSLGSGDATVEIWATQDAVRNNSIIFSYSNNGWGTAPTMEACMQWTSGTDVNKDGLWLTSDNANRLSRADTMAPYTLGKEYHIAMTFHDLLRSQISSSTAARTARSPFPASFRGMAR